MLDGYHNVKVPPDKEFCPHLETLTGISKLVLELDEPDMRTNHGGTVELDRHVWETLVGMARRALR